MERKRLERFWERCGFQQAEWGYHYEFTKRVPDWITPDMDVRRNLPELTLDNLFRYAVPQVQELGFGFCLSDSQGKPPYFVDIYSETNESERFFVAAQNQNPAVALFEALEKAIVNDATSK